MDKKVYKYELEVVDYQEVVIPKDSKILCIKSQNEKPCLWVLVNPQETEKEILRLRCAGTGHIIEEDVEYIDTVLLYLDTLVVHFFKVK